MIKEKFTVGDRLRMERERLEMSQTELATRCATTKMTQYKYEQGTTYPTSRYLRMLDSLGVDILWVVTERTGIWPLEKEDEQLLLAKWRRASPFMQRTVLALFDSEDGPAPKPELADAKPVTPRPVKSVTSKKKILKN